MSEFSKQRVLVTGGAGFIGCAMSRSLADTFGHVHVLDNLHPQIHPEPVRPAALDERVELTVADITEPATWTKALSDGVPDVVIHLAAETGTGQSFSDSTRHTLVNVVGTSRMMDAFTQRGDFPRRVVLSSSRAVYGEGAWVKDGHTYYPPQRTASSLEAGQWNFPDSEPQEMNSDTVHPRPVSVYGATKAMQEELLRVWGRAADVEIAVLRLQNVYGPGQSLSNPYTGIMSLFCRMARQGMSIPLYEDGEMRRDFVIIDDVAAALVAAATVDRVADFPLDIGSGEYQTLSRAAELIAQFYDAPAPHVCGKFREGDVRHAWANVSAAQECLAWSPHTGLAAGVEKLATWIEAQTDVPAV